MKLKLLGILALSMLISVSIFQSCTISLSGATLDPELKTFYIPNFTNNAENALPSLSQRLTEDLKDKVRAESRLVLSEEEPDIEFRGTLVDYRITAEAPRTGESTAINRLTITLAISYFNNRKNTEIWQKNFSFFMISVVLSIFPQYRKLQIKRLVNK